jgi:hypothetical protein
MIRLGSAGITALRLGGTEITRAYLGDRLVFDAAPPIPVYTITVAIDPAGSGTVAGAGQYQEGDTATITAEPADGYKFTGWQENGQQVSTGKSYSFAVTGDRTFTAVFEAKVSRLPTGYTELEYIESVKDKYYSIETPIGYKKSLSYLKIELDIMGTDSTFTGSRSIAISKNTNTSNAYSGFEIYSTALNKFGVSIYSGTNTSGGKYISGSFLNKRVLVEVDFKNKTISVDGNSASITATTSTLYSTVYLFSNTTTTSPVPLRLYSAKITYGAGLSSEKHYDFVPCKNSSGVIGLYELTDGKFYRNLASGTFIAGPAV